MTLLLRSPFTLTIEHKWHFQGDCVLIASFPTIRKIPFFCNEEITGVHVDTWHSTILKFSGIELCGNPTNTAAGMKTTSLGPLNSNIFEQRGLRRHAKQKFFYQYQAPMRTRTRSMRHIQPDVDSDNRLSKYLRLRPLKIQGSIK